MKKSEIRAMIREEICLIKEDEKHNPGDVWKTPLGNWRAKSKAGDSRSFGNDEYGAKDFADSTDSADNKSNDEKKVSPKKIKKQHSKLSKKLSKVDMAVRKTQSLINRYGTGPDDEYNLDGRLKDLKDKKKEIENSVKQLEKDLEDSTENISSKDKKELYKKQMRKNISKIEKLNRAKEKYDIEIDSAYKHNDSEAHSRFKRKWRHADDQIEKLTKQTKSIKKYLGEKNENIST